MPELPDVEGFRRLLEQCATGRPVRSVEVRDAGVLHGTSTRRFTTQVSGRRFGRPSRRGKWLLAPLDEGSPSLVWHFGMTGSLMCPSPGDSQRHPHDRVVFALDRGELIYRDQRKLQGLWLAGSTDDVDSIIGAQGPDALGIGRAELFDRLHGRRKSLKSALMDQGVVAGIGNLLADEVLWRARLHPGRRFDALGDEERQCLHRSLKQAVGASARAGRVPTGPGWLTGIRDLANATCPRCGHSLTAGRFDGRRSCWCPQCQPA